MKNKYEVRGHTTVIYLVRRNKEVIETIVDTEDLKYLLCIDTTWSANYNDSTKSYYAVANIWNGEFRDDGVKRFISIKMHRVISRAKKEDIVDHINHDTLNNSKDNLRNVTNQVNLTNRKSLNSNNKTGVRGVFLKSTKGRQRWAAQVGQKNKKSFLGYFDTIQEAEKAVIAERMRLGVI